MQAYHVLVGDIRATESSSAEGLFWLCVSELQAVRGHIYHHVEACLCLDHTALSCLSVMSRQPLDAYACLLAMGQML